MVEARIEYDKKRPLKVVMAELVGRISVSIWVELRKGPCVVKICDTDMWYEPRDGKDYISISAMLTPVEDRGVRVRASGSSKSTPDDLREVPWPSGSSNTTLCAVRPGDWSGVVG